MYEYVLAEEKETWKNPDINYTTSFNNNNNNNNNNAERNSSVGTATRYGLDGSGIKFRWVRDFPHVQTGSVAHPASYTMGTKCLFPGVKRLRRGLYLIYISSAKVKERVELHLYFPSGPSWLVPGQTFTFLIIIIIIIIIIITTITNFVRFLVLTAILPKIQVFCNMKLRRWPVSWERQAI